MIRFIRIDLEYEPGENDPSFLTIDKIEHAINKALPKENRARLLFKRDCPKQADLDLPAYPRI